MEVTNVPPIFPSSKAAPSQRSLPPSPSPSSSLATIFGDVLAPDLPVGPSLPSSNPPSPKSKRAPALPVGPSLPHSNPPSPKSKRAPALPVGPSLPPSNPPSPKSKRAPALRPFAPEITVERRGTRKKPAGLRVACQALKNKTNLFDQLSSPIIFMGDFNAHNPLWGGLRTDPRGQFLEKFHSESDFSLLNDGSPSFCHPANGTFSALDLTFVDPSLSLDYSWSTLDSLHGSDHFPILLSPVRSETISHPKRWNFTRADWPAFQSQCLLEISDQKISSIEQFSDTVLLIAKRTTPQTSTVPRKDKPWFDCRCQLTV
ncbi:hypothetical protein EGW08_006185 [Elysia chlorotica]|uniref:Endonuclease/exonuclease/phosphatase domain-containing protein n=1 Tax=Elysia chlorotica TaxID=188477 RepID=A0A3S1HTU9_ELYCH|nr:hypothetical protein EGW08_006185 [Elysia chlorotica]